MLKKLFLFCLIFTKITNSMINSKEFNDDHLSNDTVDLETAFKKENLNYAIALTVLPSEIQKTVFAYCNWNEHMTTKSNVMAIEPVYCLLAVAYSNVIQIWHLPTKRILTYFNPWWNCLKQEVIESPIFFVTTMIFSNNGQKLAFITNESSIKIFDLEKENFVNQFDLKYPLPDINLLCFSLDDQYIYFKNKECIAIFKCSINKKIEEPFEVIFEDNKEYLSSLNLLNKNKPYETLNSVFKIDIDSLADSIDGCYRILKNPLIY